MKPVQYFARCDGIRSAGPYKTEVEAWGAIMSISGVPMPGAAVWPVPVQAKRARAARKGER